jgi:hypothetical protein
LEIVNCSIPGSIRVINLAKGWRLRLVNSVVSHVEYVNVEKGNHRLEMENCIFWNPVGARAAVSNNLKETTLAVHAHGCVFETEKVLSTPLGATKWSGSGNAYAIGNVTWVWETKEATVGLPGWRKLWKSDADSIEVEPLCHDPRQWRLSPSSPAHGSAPGGKDYGADVARIAPAAKP